MTCRCPSQLLAALCAGVICLTPPAAHAQSDPRPETPAADYPQLVERGLQAYAAQNPAEARKLFAEAHALQPGARTLRALGVADLALDNYTMARDELEAALKEDSTPLTEAQRKEVEELLCWMQDNLAVLHLQVTPLQADVTIDGQPVVSPHMLLAPQEHKLSIAATGFVAQERTISVAIDRPTRLSITLEPALRVTQPARDAAPKLWPWLGGAGAVLLVAGGTVFAFGMSDKATVENARGVRLSEIQAAHDRVPILTGVGLSLGIVGLASITSAAVLLLTEREPREDMAWSLDAGLTNISLKGRF